jgi:hypothetical protein
MTAVAESVSADTTEQLGVLKLAEAFIKADIRGNGSPKMRRHFLILRLLMEDHRTQRHKSQEARMRYRGS